MLGAVAALLQHPGVVLADVWGSTGEQFWPCPHVVPGLEGFLQGPDKQCLNK